MILYIRIRHPYQQKILPDLRHISISYRPLTMQSRVCLIRIHRIYEQTAPLKC